ncbi:MAG: hypothetical protein HY508_15065 [Acidobacteria bacterium]|nr:hypothetical protein [Acidobacteriota bacterium]
MFLGELNEQQQLEQNESFLDGSFAPAKKGIGEPAKPSRARGRSGWSRSAATAFLWESDFDYASPAEVRLAEETLAAIRVERLHLAGDPDKSPHG